MMPNGSSSSHPQPSDETIATFRAFTAVDNDEDARKILDFFSWDLDRAVSAFLDNPSILQQLQQTSANQNDDQQNEQQPPTSNDTAVTERRQQPNNNPVELGTVPRWIFAIMSPFRFVWSFLSNITAKLMHLLSGPAFLIDSAPGNTPTRRFVSFYESQYGTTHPDFYDGSYAAALAASNAELKFMLVYIHSESHRLTPTFCRTILSNEAFISTASASFVTWAGSITQRDGATAHHALRVPALPFLAVIAAAPATAQPSLSSAAAVEYALLNQHTTSNFGTVLSVRAGPTLVSGGPQAATNWLARVMQRHTGILDTVRQQRVERESARLLRQQQDEEFQASLEADRQREREAEEQITKAEEERKRMENLEVRRARKKEALGEEPDKGAGVASVVLRLPDGTRVGRRFMQEEALEKVFDWAEVNGVDIEVACLVTSYPRRSLKYPEDASVTLKDAGLFPSAMLLLEERVEQ